MIEYVEWNEKNGDSIAFMEKRKKKGIATALDSMPKLDEDGILIWNAHCFMDESLLNSLHIYEMRIGLPTGWNFKECLLVLQNMKATIRKLREDE